MRRVRLNDPRTPIADVLESVGSDGLLLESAGKYTYAVLPLDADLIDYLLERSPKLSSECRRIRKQMKSGRYHTLDEVKRSLQGQGD